MILLTRKSIGTSSLLAAAERRFVTVEFPQELLVLLNSDYLFLLPFLGLYLVVQYLSCRNTRFLKEDPRFEPAIGQL